MTHTTTTQPPKSQLDDATRTSLTARAQARFDARKHRIQETTAYDQKLIATSGYAIGGPVAVEGYAIYSQLQCPHLFIADPSGTPAMFSGDAWGIGVGAFGGSGVGHSAYDAKGLVALDWVQYNVDFGADGGGAMQVTWYRNGSYVAEITVPGVGAGVGAFWGWGKFSLL